jgi:hypothetical protein
MVPQTKDQSPETILKRIDAIIQELEALRKIVVTTQAPPQNNLAEKLFGALGPGTWAEYDLDLEWQRFEV